jgi:hypothetical protein
MKGSTGLDLGDVSAPEAILLRPVGFLKPVLDFIEVEPLPIICKAHLNSSLMIEITNTLLFQRKS